MDQLLWNASSLQIIPGASLERPSFDVSASWIAAHAPWPGSAGDFGSPGTAYSPPPTSAPLPSATTPPMPTPSATVIPSAVPSPSATLSPIPSKTSPPADAPRLSLSEVMVDPAVVSDATGEWIELYNSN